MSVTISRGHSKIVLEKSKSYFATKSRQNMPRKSLFMSKPMVSGIQFRDYEMFARMEVYSVDDESELEPLTDELRQEKNFEIVSHVYELSQEESQMVMPTGEITLQFKSQCSEAARCELLSELGLEIQREFDFLADAYQVRVTHAARKNPIKLSIELEKLSDIRFAEPDLALRRRYLNAPNDELFRHQWHLKNNGGQLGLKTGADVDALNAWRITEGKRSIRVCVMDDGFDLNHPDLRGNDKIISPKDFSDEDFEPAPEHASDNHGTACAGVAIAEDNGSGVVGVAPGCSFMPIRTSGWISDRSIENLFKYALDNQADVISCSWAASAWEFPLSHKMNAIISHVAKQGRDGKGCVICFAAGNEDRPIVGEKEGKVSHQGFAAHPDVIAVGASNSLDKRSYYSNFGEHLTVCAPSSGAPGRPITTTDRLGSKGYSSEGAYTHDFGGTSSATPLVAGIAGLILSYRPHLTAEEVKEVLVSTAEKIDEDNADYDINGHSVWYGHGRVNAYQALLSLQGDGLAEGNIMQEMSFQYQANQAIPDLGHLEKSIQVPFNCSINRISVSFNIDHTWVGDLKILLRTPNQEEIVLHNQIHMAEQKLLKTITSTEQPHLFAGLMGSDALGVWTLIVEDRLQQDSGILNDWRLTLGFS